MTTEPDDQDDPSPSIDAPRISAGQRLKEERERQGITEQKVAESLHITVHYVRAIEADLYDKLPGTVFARGYIKSYAVFLGLDVADVVALYERQVIATSDILAEENWQPASRQKPDKTVVWVVLIMAILIVLAIIYWAINRFGDEGTAGETELTGSAPVAGAVNPSLVTAGTMRSVGERNPDNVIASANLIESLSRSKMEQFATNRVGKLVGVIAIGADILEIHFDGESPVEVGDSSTTRIYRDIREVGDTLRITGRAPLALNLGDELIANVAVNSTSIDISDSIPVDKSVRVSAGI